MGNHIFSLNLKNLYWCVLLAIILFFNSFGLHAQPTTTISGKLVDNSNHESVSYANLGLFRASDSKLVNGQVSDTTGSFVFSDVHKGNYILKVSMIGYDPLTMEINITDNTENNIGMLFMNQNSIHLGETVVTADRLKGQTEKDKTIYFISKKMLESSNNGLDIIKLVPGVQVDLMRNISLDGSQRILILVDGKERDKNFVSQIIPDHIEKVEILSAPPAGYDGDVTGVMNIVMKKEKKSGVSGQINLEMPALFSVYYIHPDYALNFAYKNLSLFTSYNGELIRFDQQESIFRTIKTGDESLETKSNQYVVQKLWSHNFHYGMDYSFNSKNMVSFYGFFNPYSQEYDGMAKATTEMNSNKQWEASRNTSDLNRSVFYSFYFNHIFNEKGGELTLETGAYQLKGENVATYNTVSNESAEIENSSKPFQKSLSLKVDLSMPLGHNLAFSSGVRIRSYRMQDRSFDDFKYSGEVYSAYTIIGQTISNIDWKLGLRVEKAISDFRAVFRKHYLNVLPSASLNYKISTDKTLKFSVSNTVNRPNIYQLNPNISTDDPYTIRRGNPALNPELRTAVSLEYSKKFKSNYASVRLFYNRIGNSINSVTFLNDTSVFEFQTNNFGIIHQSGFQFSGTLKIGRMIAFVPYLRLYAQFTDVNRIAEEFFVKNRSQIVVEPGFSSIISFKHDFNFGMTFQYGSPRNNITGNNFADPLYMISCDKTFKKSIKLGIVSALPFTRTFTYQGSEIEVRGLYSRYSGYINISKPLIFFKLSYQFSSGKNSESSKHGLDDIDAVPKKVGL